MLYVPFLAEKNINKICNKGTINVLQGGSAEYGQGPYFYILFYPSLTLSIIILLKVSVGAMKILKMNTHTMIRSVVLMSLIVLFICLFGYSSITRYFDKKTEIIYEKKKSPGIEAPAVTFCPMNTNTKRGWKNDNFTDLMTECSQYEEDVVSCIESGTYNLSDFLRGAERGYKTKDYLTNASLWTVELGWHYYGRCYTMNYPVVITNDAIKDQLMFYLDKQVNYKDLYP